MNAVPTRFGDIHVVAHAGEILHAHRLMPQSAGQFGLAQAQARRQPIQPPLLLDNTRRLTHPPLLIPCPLPPGIPTPHRQRC